MATLTFSYNTGSVPLSKIIDAYATKFGYDKFKLANETKAQFATRMVRSQIVTVVKEADIMTARAAADAGITEINLT